MSIRKRGGGVETDLLFLACLKDLTIFVKSGGSWNVRVRGEVVLCVCVCVCVFQEGGGGEEDMLLPHCILHIFDVDDDTTKYHTK